MDIRVLNEKDDLDAFKALRIEAVENSPIAFGESVEEVKTKSIEGFKYHLADHGNGDFVVGAHIDGKLVGVAGFYREPHDKHRHKGNIWGVYVQPDHRTKGTARALLNNIIEIASNLSGLEQIHLRVATSSVPAVTLYKSLGFAIFGTEPRAVNVEEVFYDEHYMQLLL